MANVVGVAILHGFPGGNTSTVTGLGNLAQLQSAEFGSTASKEEIKDANGNTSSVVYSDHKYSLVWDFVVQGATATTNAANITISALPSIGSTLSATDSNFSVISAGWLVDDIKVSRGNAKAMMASITISRYLTNSVPT